MGRPDQEAHCWVRNANMDDSTNLEQMTIWVYTGVGGIDSQWQKTSGKGQYTSFVSLPPPLINTAEFPVIKENINLPGIYVGRPT